MEQKFKQGEHVLAHVPFQEFAGVVKRCVDGVYWIKCDTCPGTHVALEEEMELIVTEGVQQ